MKTIIKASSLLCLICLFMINAKAQSGKWMNKPADERAKIITDWMVEKLNLTEDQEPEVYEINLKYAQKGTKLKESTVGKREKFQVLKDYDTAKDKEFEAVFTDEQYVAYQDKKNELRQKIKEHRKGGED